MNQLETNLTLWAICSILLFEILIIICLCRCCFNRMKPKKFYVKREEYKYLHDINNGTQSTILRAPHSDELAHIGTLRVENPLVSYNDGFQNLGFYRDDKDERSSPIQLPSSQYWIELQSPIINTAQLPPADYEIHSYPTDDYLYRQPPPRSTIIDFRPYRDDYIDADDEIEDYRLHSLRRPEIILPQVQRIDTSTESYGLYYANIVPKSILKSGTSTTPPVDLPSTAYMQIQHSQISSKHDESPQTSAQINTNQSIPIHYPTISIQKRIPVEPIFSPTIPLSSKHRMKFANVRELNDIEWEVPREFQSIFHSNHERRPSLLIDTKTYIPWQGEMNLSQSDYLSNSEITQQQAFEY